MALRNLGETEASRDFNRNLKSTGQGGLYKQIEKYTREWYILADSTGYEEDEILNTAPGIPKLGNTLNGAYCLDLKVKEASSVFLNGDDGMLYIVSAEFTTDVDSAAFTGGGEGSGGEEEPVTPTPPEDYRPTRRWYGQEEMEALEYDVVTGEPIETKAGEKIALEAPATYAILEVSRYEAYPFMASKIIEYTNKINSAIFYGSKPGTVLMLSISSDEVQLTVPDPLDPEGVKQIQKWFCKVTYTLKFKVRKERPANDITQPAEEVPGTWLARVLHEGTMFRPSAGAKPEQAVDKYKNPIRVNLLDDGTKNPSDDPKDRKYLTFSRFHYIDFTPLGLEF